MQATQKNLKTEQIVLKLDPKLRHQLQEYADRNDDGNLSLTARRALKMFVEENKL